jgi:hypothetical protein
MTDCAECRRLERQLEYAAIAHLRVSSTYRPEDERTKAAKRKADRIQERFNNHKASHGIALGSSGW